MARYEGGRSVAEFEMFFQTQKQKRKDALASVTSESSETQPEAPQLEAETDVVSGVVDRCGVDQLVDCSVYFC